VQEELTRRRELDSIGGPSYLAFLTEGIPRNFNIENYVRIAKNKALLRSIAKFAVELGNAAGDQSDEGVEVATWGVSRLAEMVEHGSTQDAVIGSEELAKQAVVRLITHPSEDEVIPTGIAELDEFTGGGIRLGEMWVIGASPSRGKTTLARQIAKNVVWRDTGVYVHSGEMSKESWFDVTACLLEGMQAWKIREPRLMNLTERERLLGGIRDLAKMPLYLSDTGGIHIDKLIWNATQAIRRYKTKLTVIDYAQIIKAAGDDKQKVSTVAQRFRQFLKDTHTAGILLSQSPRPDGKNLNQRPTMFSLKESGSLEEAAHTVILPYRPIDLETGKFTGDDELIIGKQRWGSIGSIKTHLNGAYLRFDSRE
jgi:replicative DNA helicase